MSVHPLLLLNVISISHFSSQSSKNLRTQSKCPTPKTHVQCLPVLHHYICMPSNIPVPPSPLAASETTSFDPPTPVTPLRDPPQPFASPIPYGHMGNHIWATTYPSATCPFRRVDGASVNHIPTYGQPHTPVRHVRSGASMVHQCQPQQYQPYLAYLDS